MVTLERTELRSKCGDRAGRSSARESERSEAFRLRRAPAGAQACQRHHLLISGVFSSSSKCLVIENAIFFPSVLQSDNINLKISLFGATIGLFKKFPIFAATSAIFASISSVSISISR